MTQKLIPIDFNEDHIFNGFKGEANRPVVDYLKSFSAHNNDQTIVYLWGDSGSGKTHLLLAAYQSAIAAQSQASYIKAQAFANPNWRPQQTAAESLVCIDDLHQAIGHADIQSKLMQCYEYLLPAQGRLLIAADRPPKHLQQTLPDLISRLSAGVVFQLQNLTEIEKKTLLKERAANRGFDLDDNVINYMFNHAQRDLNSLIVLLEQLDSLSLITQRKITIPLLKQVLKQP